MLGGFMKGFTIMKYFIGAALFCALVCHTLFAASPGGQWTPARALPRKPGVEPVLVKVHNWGLNNTISLNYQVPQPKFTPSPEKRASAEKEEACIIGNAMPVYTEGEPVLPAIITKVILPYGHTVDKVTVVRGQATAVPGTHYIEYGPAAVALMPGAKVRTAVPKNAIYDSDNAFPNQTHKQVTVQRKRGVTYAFFRVYPATYYPKSRRLEYYKNISVQITTKPDKNAANSGIRVRLDGMREALNEVENSAMFNTYTNGRLDGAYQKGICNPQDEFKWVFITNNTIKNATASPNVTEYAQYRVSTGLSAKIATVEEIYAAYTGVDNPEKVRKFIIDAYNNWKTDFVVLGGDISVVPLRQLYVYVDDEYKDNIDSDIYFQCLEGNYNFDNDADWGEPDDGPDYSDVDLMAEVYIGRIAAENPAEMGNALHKMRIYETDPADLAYLKKALMQGEKLGWEGDMEYATASLREIVNGVDSLSLKGFKAAPEFSIDSMYDSPTYTWKKNDCIAKINSNNYGIIHHFGHANATYGMKLANGDETKLLNNKYAFGYSQGCLMGEFSKDCIAERLTSTNTKGLWGCMFNSNLGFGYQNNINGPSQVIAREFWDAFFGENLEYVGALNQDSHEDNIPDVGSQLIRWSIYESNIFGDPAIKIRGKIIPSFITVTQPNGGEKWEQGRTFEIKWNDNISGNVKIEVLKGAALHQLLAAADPSDGSYMWNIAADFALGTNYKIRVTAVDNGALVDESFDTFAIEQKSSLTLTAPNGGETVLKASVYQIQWIDNLPGNVNIDLYKGGSACKTIMMNAPSNGSYTWNVPEIIAKGTDYKVRITSVDKSWLFVESAAGFTIENPVIKNFPHIENFDDWEVGPGPMGGFWDQAEGSDDEDWTTFSGPTPSISTGPDADHTTGTGKYVYTEASGNGSPGKKFIMTTPVFDFNHVTGPSLSFFYHMFSDSNRMGRLYVDVCENGTWKDSVVYLAGNKGNQWLEAKLNLASYAGKLIQFRFRSITGADAFSDLAIDDFKIDGQQPVDHLIVRVPLSFDMRYYGSRIYFQIPANRERHISIKLFNMQGKLIRTLVNGVEKTGYHSLPLNSSNSSAAKIAAGLYLCKMETKGYTRTVQVLIRQ